MEKMRSLKQYHDCIGCYAYYDTGMLGHEVAHCKLGYANQIGAGMPWPMGPCPKPQQYRTFLKSPKNPRSPAGGKG